MTGNRPATSGEVGETTIYRLDKADFSSKTIQRTDVHLDMLESVKTDWELTENIVFASINLDNVFKTHCLVFV